VTGKVTLDGQPVAGARVIFTDGKETNMPTGPTALTDEAGEYALVGVPPGSYKVVVFKLVPKPGMALPPADENGSVDFEQIEASGAGIHKLPKKYLSPTTTTIVAQVKEGSHVENIELKSK
jgi:hypothetical protein